MDVRCERCRAQYVFDDEQVTSSGLTVQCTNCGHVFKVKKKELVVTVPVKPGELEGTPLPATAAAPRAGGTRASLPAIPAVQPPAPPAAAERPREPDRPREWRVRQASGNIFTFRELTTLQKWIIEQKVSRDDEISLSGDQWKRLGNIAELASFFQVVEAAERSRTQVAQPALTPLPMPAVPVYGVALPPLYQGTAPPTPYPGAYAGAAAPEYRAPEAAAVLPPVHEVDLGPDVERAPRRSGRTRLLVLVLASLGAGAVAAYTISARLFAAPSVSVPLTFEVKDQPPPEPPVAPPAPPVPAPEAVAEPALQSPPEQIVKPARTAPKGPKALLSQAKKAFENGNAEDALEIYGRVASEDPENAEALTGRGLCYLDLESYPPAEASFLAALRLEPGQPDALLGLAESYRFQGKRSEAISYYDKYLAQHPDGEDAEVARNALAELRK